MNNLYASQYLLEAKLVIEQLDLAAIDKMTVLLIKLRENGGRLFLIGVGEVLATQAMLSTTLGSLQTLKHILPAITSAN